METEFKFHIPPERLKGVEAAMRRGAVVRTRLQARYFDTAGQLLAAHGMVLRLRKEGRRWVQTVKAAGEGPLQRWEHNVDLGLARSGIAPTAEVQRHQGTPVGDRLIALLARHADAPLVETYATDVWRLTRDVRVTGSTVELALDIGKVVAHAGTPAMRESTLCELELELKRGEVDGLVALAHRWSQQHGLWFSTVSKAERGTRLLAAPDGAGGVPAVKAEAPRFAPSSSWPDGAAIQRAVVAACLAHILPNASEIAAGSRDEEQAHQLRIGIRRLRTALRELDGLDARNGYGFDAVAWTPPLVDAFRALGVRRDREQVLQLAEPQLRAAGAPEIELSEAVVGAITPSAEDIVRAPAFQAVLVALIGFSARTARATPQAPDATAEPQGAAEPLDAGAARRLLRKRLQKLHDRTLEEGARFESLENERQHGVRKRLKRLRYLAEFLAPLFEAEAGKDDKEAPERYLKQLRPAQDALGHFNDEAVAQALYREATMQDPRAWFAVGWFNARHAVGATACREALGKIAKAPSFWKKKSKKSGK